MTGSRFLPPQSIYKGRSETEVKQYCQCYLLVELEGRLTYKTPTKQDKTR